MSSIQDKLKQSQGQVSTTPKLEISHVIEVKEENKDILFLTYDKESKTNLPVDSPIIGIFIGAAAQMSSYSDNLGKDGAQYRSDYYFNNKSISLFAPQGGKYTKVITGTKDELVHYLGVNSTGSAKVRQVLFVLNELGLVAVVTNMTIAIDQYGRNKEALQSKYIKLTPSLFFEEDEDISKKAKDFLGKFRTKNPPKYAKIEVGEAITDEDFTSWNADKHIDDFIKFKAFKTADVVKIEPAPAKEEGESINSASSSQGNTSQPAEENDPLPF